MTNSASAFTAYFGEPIDTDGEVAGAAMGAGYSVLGAHGHTKWAITQLLEVMSDLSEPERRKLASASPHAFRHAVGTQMLAAGVALEVVQRTLGHASLGTTSIYVSPEEARMRREAAKYHAAGLTALRSCRAPGRPCRHYASSPGHHGCGTRSIT